MLWFAQLYRSGPKKRLIALGLIGFGIAIEFAQEQTGYRQFEVADMVADGIGVAMGLALRWVCCWARPCSPMLCAKRNDYINSVNKRFNSYLLK